MAHPSDEKLLEYARACSLTAGAPSQRLTLHPGYRTALMCATKDCPGSPRREVAEWKCSACRKPWPVERVELGRNEVGLPKHQRSKGGINGSQIDLHDIGVILDQLEEEIPWATVAWVVYVLSPGDPTEGKFGISKDDTVERVAELQVSEELHGMPDPTLWRVKAWINAARRRFYTIALQRGVLGQREEEL